jgi:3-oxoacid CoA-transferase subunit B
MLGIGPFPTEDEVDADLINAGKQTVTTMPGTSIFSSDSLCHDPRRQDQPVHPGRDAGQRAGDLANWMIPGKMVKGMGGAMDLVAGVKRVIVLMEHVAARRTAARTSRSCPSAPCRWAWSTHHHRGVGVVDRIITDLDR